MPRPVVLAILAIVSVGAATPGITQAITDGDTLQQGGVTYRLWGIDAPELSQHCPDGWPAGHFAGSRLAALLVGRDVVCQEKDRDRHGRVIAICRAAGEDLGAILVREGFAWAFVQYSSDYVDLENRANAAGLGVHKHRCSPAWEWRARQRTR